MDLETIKVLFIDDDEDDSVLVKELLSEAHDVKFEMDWVDSYQSGLEAISSNRFDICLVDYYLGEYTGLDLLRQLIGKDYLIPVIILTGQGNRQIDMEAMQNGAADYLVKSELNALLLERSIRYALADVKAERKIQNQLLRLQALHRIDQSITSNLDKKEIFSVLLNEVITQLNVDAACILQYEPERYLLKYAAGSGFHTDETKHTAISFGEGYAGRAAKNRRMIHIPDMRCEDDNFVSRLVDDEGFVSYYGLPMIAKGAIKGVLEIFHREVLQPDPEWLYFMEMLTNQAAIALDNITLFSDLQESKQELELAYDTTLDGWARALELRDFETKGHSARVTDLSVRLAAAMGFSKEERVHIARGAILHDVGKLAVPDHVLLKNGSLNDEEWQIVRQHPLYGYEMLLPIAFLKPSLNIVLYHHERWDGTGYPSGLRERDIPLHARLFAVVDVWDAVTNDRPYRKAWNKSVALEFIKQQSETHFDPDVVNIFSQVICGLDKDLAKL